MTLHVSRLLDEAALPGVLNEEEGSDGLARIVVLLALVQVVHKDMVRCAAARVRFVEVEASSLSKKHPCQTSLGENALILHRSSNVGHLPWTGRTGCDRSWPSARRSHPHLGRALAGTQAP